MRWRENDETGGKYVAVAPHGEFMQWWAFHRRHTFDHDMDGVVHRTELIPGRTAVIPCIRRWHVHNTKSPLKVKEKRSLGWEIATHFGPGDFRGWPGTKDKARQRVLTPRAGLAQKKWWNPFTYSPSAMHSISSTCPLSTVLELEGPDGMRNVGFLLSAGSSIVIHRFRNKLLPTLLQ